jgi:hypothetical protein
VETNFHLCFSINMWCGAPSHYNRLMMQHLNDTFPNQWIGHGSIIDQPPRSADLTLLDFVYRVGWTVKCTDEKYIHRMNCSITYKILLPT